MKEKDEKKEQVNSEQENWTQPLLTKHEQLRTLTGKSGEKDPDENDDPPGNHGRGHEHGHGPHGHGKP